MVITWFRFFCLFLLLQKVSKLLLTLLRMVMDTISFTFIIFCFTLLMATAFTIRFAEVDPEFYGDILLSMRSLFDLMVTNWYYRDLKNFNTAHSVFVIFHVMITNVFLLNYLIALLSTVYNIMLERGEYSYKALKYNFYEKFKSVLSDESGIAIMYINPPPLNFFSCLLIPFLCCQKPRPDKSTILQTVSHRVSKIIYWFENVAMCFVNFLMSLFVVPVIYFLILGRIF